MYLPLLKAIDNSFHQLTGDFLPSPNGIKNRLEWIHHNSDYALLAHSYTKEPVFIYANNKALEAFRYDWDEFIGMPSKNSAAVVHQTSREQQLAKVSSAGIIFGYEGIRINKQGREFHVYDGIIWNVKNYKEELLGQAALFYRTKTTARD